MALNDSTFQPAALQSAGGNESVVVGSAARRAVRPGVGMDEYAVWLALPQVLGAHAAKLDELGEFGRRHGGSIVGPSCGRAPTTSEVLSPTSNGWLATRARPDSRVEPELCEMVRPHQAMGKKEPAHRS